MDAEVFVEGFARVFCHFSTSIINDFGTVNFFYQKCILSKLKDTKLSPDIVLPGPGNYNLKHHWL